jgi:hypothetical protein
VPLNETQARADAIKEALVARGVEAARIEAVGVGGGASRVDFLVVETAAAPKAPAAGQSGGGAAEQKPDAPKSEAPKAETKSDAP